MLVGVGLSYLDLLCRLNGTTAPNNLDPDLAYNEDNDLVTILN